jgi:glycosyltransferase involved in cell wall biosynthesis
MAQADVLVMPSVQAADGRMEGIPVTIMEAMSLSLPVVATDVGAVGEIVYAERTGLLVPPRDAEALAAAIDRLNEDERFASELASAARKTVESEFDLVASVTALQELFDAPAHEAGPSRRPTQAGCAT